MCENQREEEAKINQAKSIVSERKSESTKYILK